jgi:hypothetical protein
VVLLVDHAFVGYWRSEGAHDQFHTVDRIPANLPEVGSRAAREAALPYVDAFGWRLTKLNHAEMMVYVNSGHLVMLEATYLTAAKSFAEAKEQGRADLRSRNEFDSMLDIQVARTAVPPITPLPIINE